MDGFSIKRLLRRPWLSILSLIIGGVMCYFLCYLANYRADQERQLEDLLENYEIQCVVTDIKGRKADDLRLSTRYTDFITDEENGLGMFTDDIRFTKEFEASTEDGAWTLVGISNAKCDEYTDPRFGGGYETTIEDFFDSEEAVCLMSRESYDKYKDQEIMFNVVDPYGRALGLGVGEIFLTVGGFHNGGDDKIFMPYKTATRLSSRITHSISTDTVVFVLKDNSKVDEVYLAAETMLPKVDPDSYTPGFALTIKDQVHKANGAKLRQDIARTGYLLTLISILGFCAGFLVGFLGTKGETRNYALMRTLGMRGFKLFLTVLFEQQILTLIACVIVGIITKRPLTAAIFFVCHALGTLIAVIKPVSARPTKLLRDQE